MKDACVLFIVINCLLLEKDGSVSIHHKNIQSLAIEMFQIKHGQSPEIVGDILHKQRGITISGRIKILGYVL